MINKLIKIANHLDKINLTKEADQIDFIIKKLSASSINPDLISDEDILGSDRDRFSMMSPEEKLLNKIIGSKMIRNKYQGYSPEEVAKDLGLHNDKEMIDLISSLMDKHGLYYSP